MPRPATSDSYVEHGIRRKGDGFQVRVHGLTRSARTLTDARTVRSQLEQERRQSFGQATSREKLGIYLRRWLDIVKATRRPGTYRAWEPAVRLRMLSHRIAHVPLNELTPADVQRWIADIGRTGVSGRTQHKYCEALSAALNDALAQGLIVRSPLVGVRKPRQERYVPTVWTPTEMRAFMVATESDPSRYVQALRFIAYIGCRVSDACNALETDVDSDGHTILIRHGKTDAAYRRIPLIPEAVRLLAGVMKAQDRERWYWLPEQKNGPRWLFRRKDGRPLNPRSIEEAIHRVAAAQRLPDCRVHDLRHAFATNGLRAGIDRRLLGRALGHANEAMTGLYQHVDEPLLHRAVDGVAATWRELEGEVCPHCGGTGRLPSRLKQAAGGEAQEDAEWPVNGPTAKVPSATERETGLYPREDSNLGGGHNS